MCFIFCRRGEPLQPLPPLNSELRRAVEWIAKDVRQARRVDVGNTSNDPSSSHIKFHMVTGYLPAAGDVTMSSNTIEYAYNNNSKMLVRTETTSDMVPHVKTWVFRYIDLPVFFTKVKSGSTHTIVPIDGVEGSPSPVIQSGNLVIWLVGRKQLGVNEWTGPFTLMQEVRIRN